jgi:hypothetical protein
MVEIAVWGIVGLILGAAALAAGWYEREQAHSQELKYERDRGELIAQIQRSSGYNQGAFERMDRRLEDIASAVTPEIRQQVISVRSGLEAELVERMAREWPRPTASQRERLVAVLQRNPQHEVGERVVTIARKRITRHCLPSRRSCGHIQERWLATR